MNYLSRFRALPTPVQYSAVYLALWSVFLLDLRTLMLIPAAVQSVFLLGTLPLLGYWIWATRWGKCYLPRQRWVVATVGYVLLWHMSMHLLHVFIMDAARASLARWGTVALFLIGLLWVVWGVEQASAYYYRIRGGADRDNEQWNPLDLSAWFYAIRWWPLSLVTLFRFLRCPKDPSIWPGSSRSRKLDQSLVALSSYCILFLLLAILFGQINGCREIYEMPAGGGEQKQLAQVVKIKKVVRKKYIVNPLSAISFEVPPIDEVQLKLTEITKHAYTVGYGAGKGAGFSEGTFRGKVRFIRIEYSGGDWDQDYGIGGDLNMLLEYGIRTQHKVSERTESRTVSQLRNFPKGKSPPIVYMTGQRNISLSNSEIKTLREYLIDKHGMIFGDNGGSRHFHNQFMSMMNRVLPDTRPVPIPLDDMIHRIPYQIPYLPYVAPHGGKDALGWYKDGRWVAYYHPGDIGDAWADGHAGVKAEIWESCYQIGTNVIFYAHAEYSKWLEAQKKD